MNSARHVAVSNKDGIATVRIDRPSVRNAFDYQTIAELTEIAHDLQGDANLRAVILTGSSDFFSSGQDLSARRDGTEPNLLERRTRMRAGPELVRAWEEIEAVTIAAIEGYCIGGACALALACDFRILGAEGWMRLPEVPLGMNMPWRTLPRLTGMIGASRAKRMTIFGEKIDAETCLAWGLADEVVATGNVLQESLKWAGRISGLPPLPVRMTKEAVNAAANALNHLSAYMDRDQYLLTSISEDLEEGIAAFRNKRPPKFSGN